MASETRDSPDAVVEVTYADGPGPGTDGRENTSALDVPSRAPLDSREQEVASRPSAQGGPQQAEALGRFLDALERAPQEFDFFQTLRRLEHLTRDRDAPNRPRFGAALRPADEPIRLGQEPSLAFAPAALDSLQPGRNGAPPQLMVSFFGLLGPNGPLPLHLTEYARDRTRNAGDPTMKRFLNLFHHRMLMFFYRAWSSVEPTANQDRVETNRFTNYVGSLPGLGMASLQHRDAFPDSAKLYYAGLFSMLPRNAEGLSAVIGDFFRMPTRVESFMGARLEIPKEYRWSLGRLGPNKIGLLGQSTTLGANAWSRQHKFRVVLGPLNRAQFQSMLPGGAGLRTLTDLVRNYSGDELRWDLRLFLEEQVDEAMRLKHSRLGWTSWLGKPGPGTGRREDLILDPQAEDDRRAA